jgi:hypothetical protein
MGQITHAQTSSGTVILKMLNPLPSRKDCCRPHPRPSRQLQQWMLLLTQPQCSQNVRRSLFIRSCVCVCARVCAIKLFIAGYISPLWEMRPNRVSFLLYCKEKCTLHYVDGSAVLISPSGFAQFIIVLHVCRAWKAWFSCHNGGQMYVRALVKLCTLLHHHISGWCTKNQDSVLRFNLIMAPFSLVGETWLASQVPPTSIFF